MVKIAISSILVTITIRIQEFSKNYSSVFCNMCQTAATVIFTT